MILYDSFGKPHRISPRLSSARTVTLDERAGGEVEFCRPLLALLPPSPWRECLCRGAGGGLSQTFSVLAPQLP